MNAPLHRLLEARAIETFAATDEEVIGRWRAEVGSFHDSHRVMTAEMRVSVSYQAGLQAAMTLVRAAGYRVRSQAGGHHYATFATVAALESGDLARVATEMTRMSRRRHRAVYDWVAPGEAEEALNPDDVESTVAELMNLAHQSLMSSRPHIATLLVPPREEESPTER